ncbi:MAG: Nse4 C-terminal-domain-containing protein [Lentinula lateritia]|uniref:Non-structural maintenance of chromosomes element 4 n=1 Tax=Lentinula lateritia TaxID=40482 RepID=A0ABQ8VNZ0_9AGAR|nr:MAG: Nse4 C-terminal-domain-containing protein [Lentinula lateritia]KAJ4498109.1 Nse4 C-terminal-domain-containing protein [Lentinula lateritia]
MSDVEMEYASELPYDPDQDAGEKRAVRREYRAIHKDMEDFRQNIKDCTVDNLADAAKRADKVFYKVKNPTEATLDSSVLLQLTASHAQMARSLKSGSGAFDIDDYLANLVSFMGGHKLDNQNPDDPDADDALLDAPLDWDKIGRTTLAKSKRVPVVGFMLGPLSIEQKKRAPVKRAKLEKNKADERKPQELKEEDIARSVNETTKNVATLESILAETGAINLFRFVVNPKSFAQSVENMFYLSFLIRDGKVALDTDEQGEPTIFGCAQPSDEDYADGLRKRQIVFELDMATWKRAIDVFEITEPTIPTRESSKMKIGNKWYG